MNNSPPTKPDNTISTLEILHNTLDHKHAIDPKVIKFLMSYIENRSVGDAAKLAGLPKESGKRILNKVDVQAALVQIQQTQGRKASFDAAELLERTNEIAQIDPIDVFNPDGTVKAIEDIPSDVRRAIKELVVREVWENDINGVRVCTGYVKTIKFWDKMKGLEMLGKYDGVFREKVEHTVDVGGNLAALLLGAEKRATEREVGNVARLEMTGDPIVDQAAVIAIEGVKLDE